MVIKVLKMASALISNSFTLELSLLFGAALNLFSLFLKDHYYKNVDSTAIE